MTTRQIIGYGEDALTYRALSRDGELKEILRQLHDDTPPEECRVFYRPSFGRGGRGRAAFGEFDAIIVAQKCIYLVESKWCRPHDSPRPDFVVDEGQLARHDVFKRYLREWRARRPLTWEAFVEGLAADGVELGRALPAADADLAANLAHILGELSPVAEVKDVLLYFSPGTQNSLSLPNAPGFSCVTLAYTPIGESGFFEM